MDELKPCPFCGTTNMMKHDEDCYFTVLNLGLDTWRINTAWNRRAETQWQPIETAPKDGIRIILGNRYGTWMGEFCDTYQSGYKPQNPWQSVLLNHDHISKQRSYFPTHWMPLPAAPEVKHA
jgi:hypothetical protein